MGVAYVWNDSSRCQLDHGPGDERDKHDQAYQRISFTKFPDNTSDDAKVAAITTFMQKNFKENKFIYIDHFNPKASFVHFGTPKAAKAVMDKLKGKAVDGFAGVKVKPALTAIDLSRNYALFKAEELIKGDPKSAGKTIETRMGKDRGVYVSDIAAFAQKERFEPKGSFEGEFVHLRLP